MGEFLQNNWFWIVLIGLLIWMHGSGMGCSSHGGHGHHRQDDDRDENRTAGTGHRH